MTTLTAERIIEIPLLTYGNEGKSSKVTRKVNIPDSLNILENDDDIVPNGCGIFSILTEDDGDKRVVWNTMNIPEINDAKKMFDSLVKQGMTAFLVGKNGQQSSKEMKKFDPHVGEIVFAPARAMERG